MAQPPQDLDAQLAEYERTLVNMDEVLQSLYARSKKAESNGLRAQLLAETAQMEFAVYMRYASCSLLCEKALLLDSTNILALEHMRYYYLEIDSIQAVIECLEKLRTLDPRNPHYHYHTALILNDSAHVEEAISHLNEAIAKWQSFEEGRHLLPVVYTKRASLHLELGHLDAAVRDVDRSQEIMGNEPYVYAQWVRGLIYLARRDTIQACAQWNQINIHYKTWQFDGVHMQSFQAEVCTH